MEGFRYLEGVSTLCFDVESCVGCGMCRTVCPHGVFAIDGGKAGIKDIDACMECGACARNCASDALSVTPGVGCASHVIRGWLGRETSFCTC